MSQVAASEPYARPPPSTSERAMDFSPWRARDGTVRAVAVA